MYRGKRKDTGEWVYGWYVKDWDGRSYIITKFGPYITGCSDCGAHDQDIYEVDPETVGQYTGLKDRHGQEIYEGDILRDDEMGLNVVRWEDGSFWLEMFYEGNQSLMEHLSDYNEVCEIIGNIYENPELLKGEETA